MDDCQRSVTSGPPNLVLSRGGGLGMIDALASAAAEQTEVLRGVGGGGGQVRERGYGAGAGRSYLRG